MIRYCLMSAAGFFLCANILAQSGEPTTVTLTIRGVIAERDAKVLRARLSKVKGIKFNATDIQPGEKGQFGHYFSPPFTIKIVDLNKTDIGALAKVVADVKTPSRREIKPSLNLSLYKPSGSLEESDIVSIRQALTDVNGVEAQATGGIGGVLSKGRFWVRLEAAGGANLSAIRAALKKAELDLRLVKSRDR